MSNKVDFSKIPNETLEEYNIMKFNNADEIFNFLFDEDYTKEDVISNLTEKIKEEIVLGLDNVRFQNGTFYYGNDIYDLEKDMSENMNEIIATFKDEERNLKVEIVKVNNEKYFNYYYSDDMEHWNSNSGPFKTEIEARKMVQKHRPTVKEDFEVLENNIKEKLRLYDKHQEELNKEWQEINNLKPNNMDFLEFQRLLQKARYETKQLNLDNEMLNNFEHNNPLEVKNWIHKGADKQKLYNNVAYLHSKNYSLTMNQAWLLEDLHNIRKEKHFPYTYDREISDPRIITKDNFNELYKKFEEKEKTGKDLFTEDEKDMFLLKDGDSFVVIDNITGNLYTEEFKDRNLAVRYIQGESIDKLRDEEQRYEVLIYETEEDYNKGEPFQEHIYTDLEEAKKSLEHQIKLNNYYAGNVRDQITGEELYAVELYPISEIEEDEGEEP